MLDLAACTKFHCCSLVFCFFCAHLCLPSNIHADKNGWNYISQKKWELKMFPTFRQEWSIWQDIFSQTNGSWPYLAAESRRQFEFLLNKLVRIFLDPHKTQLAVFTQSVSPFSLGPRWNYWFYLWDFSFTVTKGLW